ncbi:MAG: response regulator [Deltaproteobacteria bacterium CG23_combo_of_CG06-09_8_20_14_all_51_20]|nr:response regulator [bacterium]PIP45013.1 MAG: response regulator [Deltaproteobacteria bacterium CG23_combo_of_CG06-09_8_20_14_all_51_20]PIY21734.1 MAG: response regulator [Deltaproteobacteria bacterium CG_4_10_14_3_um_filter_51_14]PJB36188.1 MAG: response regulator [Deltaproteobacteria bacterium CG_4_9_14_3_um_filter_51_14]
MVAANKTSILVLDDETIVLKRLRPALEKAGYEVEVFSRSSEASERITQKDFEIVITDLKMPGLDGMQFLTMVKERSPTTEAIVITGFATMETAKESFQKGAFDFLAKPFKLGEIQEIVKKAEAKVLKNRMQ